MQHTPSFRNLAVAVAFALLTALALLFPAAANAGNFDFDAAYDYVREVNPNIKPATIRTSLWAVKETSRLLGISPTLLLAIMKVESTFYPDARSPRGAQGLTQVMPRWHGDKLQDAKAIYGTDSLRNPFVASYAGARVYLEYLDQAKGNRRVALTRYNGGGKTYADTVLREEARIRQALRNV